MNKREKVFYKTNGICYYCGENLSFGTFHMDHIIPKNKGGTSDINNIVPSCSDCNLRKGDLTINEFRKKIKNLNNKPLIKFYCKFINISPTKVLFAFEINPKPWDENNGKT